MQMTSKADYTDEEWIRLRRAPFVAGMAITIADPGGPIEIAKESFATLKAASAPSSQQELLVAVSQDIQSMAHERQNPMGDFKPESSALAANYVLDELRAVNESYLPRQRARKLTRSAGGCWTSHRPPPMRRRRAASWASGPSW
jgi:hypothetical protein